jgi:CXXX repeat modification system protein
MRSLILLLDRAAPSFCYYASPASAEPRAMSAAVLDDALAWGAARGLALQVLAGAQGVPAAVRERLAGREHICYLPAAAPGLEPDDVPVVDASAPEPVERLTADKHMIAILRVPRDQIAAWPGVWRALAGRVERVVLVLLELERWTEEDLARYRESLEEAALHLGAQYAAGRLIELSALSDRLVLDAPVECGAGVDHLTVDPEGLLYLCPGFALDGLAAVGDLRGEPQVPNAQLLTRERAPICTRCDAYHCRRCVHLNLRATEEINTPPWQICRAAHHDREVARGLLGRLHARGQLRQLAPIPSVSYEEPFEALTGHKMRVVPRPRPTPPTRNYQVFMVPLLGDPAKEESMTKKEPTLTAQTSVGRVTPEERDEIKELFMRKNALNELFLTLSKLDAATLDSNPLYDKVVRDMGQVTLQFQSWWDTKAKVYGWKSKAGGSWNIDFETCEIYLT